MPEKYGFLHLDTSTEILMSEDGGKTISEVNEEALAILDENIKKEWNVEVFKNTFEIIEVWPELIHQYVVQWHTEVRLHIKPLTLECSENSRMWRKNGE